MNEIYLRKLQIEDAASLLLFECDNRTWFETHIEPRHESFYSMEGVATHIHALLESYAQGGFHPCVLTDGNGAIVGRANLKDIRQDRSVAEIGYRIGQQHVGQGLATQAVGHLIKLARSQWQIKCLVAFVTEENIASARVLEKWRFAHDGEIKNLTVVQNKQVHGYKFSLDVDTLDIDPANTVSSNISSLSDSDHNALISYQGEHLKS